MNLVLRFIEVIGDKTISTISSFFEALKFTSICLIHMAKPASYNPAMRMVLTKQIYFTAVGIIPLFTTMAVLFGSVIIGVVIALATEYGLQDEIGSIIITFVIDEFSPFFTALLISLRSGTAVNTEIAVMNVNQELNTLRQYNIDLIDYLFLPRIISGMISVVSLSILFAVIILSSGYLFTLFYMNMDFHTYKYLLINAIELNGMVKLFVALFFIEVLSLLLQSL
jgi:phospholipid/cholesterol/gamma-HCH transport system permease protein